MPRTNPLIAWVAIVLATAGVARGAGGVFAPERLAVEPGDTVLRGRRAGAQLIATAYGAGKLLRDATREGAWASRHPEIAEVSARGRVVPRSNGETEIVARLGSLEAAVVVRVEGMEAPAPVSFRRDVIPALSQAGCNTGACHGTPTGKGGFKLSLRGYLPEQDYRTLTRELAMRRLNLMEPEASMLLTKPLGLLPHEGGKRLFRGTAAHEVLRDWIVEGAKDDPGAVEVERLEALPGGDRILEQPAGTQQLVVRARGVDGSSRDVTPICYYDSSNAQIAEVDADGHVTFKGRGEVAIIAHYLDKVAVVRLTHLVDVPGFQVAEVPTANLVDGAVYRKLNHMRIAVSDICTDEEFLRRAYLDLTGQLPPVEQLAAFRADGSADKRERLVSRLLEEPAFYDFWAMKLADVLRSNSRLIQNKGTHLYQRWIRASLERGEPMDQFVRELLTSRGSTFRNPAANYYRVADDPESSVETTAQLFLGVRIQCAKCHNHPYERWTQDDYYGFAAFFARVREKPGSMPEEEVIFSADGGDVRQPRTGQVMKPKALGGPVLEPATAEGDRREQLALWLTRPENPFFARSLANRVWYHLMGRGIVEPVDDFRDSNPASNAELLDALAADFATNGFDLKRLIRTIATSRTYQLSARTTPLNADDMVYFSHAYPRLLPAEVLLDAITTVTGTASKFDGLPEGARATQISDGKLDNPFLKTFGRPARELACECERESNSNLSQALQLIGGETVNGKLRDDNGRMARLAGGGASAQAIATELYQVALTRDPSAEELAAAVEVIEKAADRRQAIEDLGWVVINSKEFLFRH